MSDEAIGLRLIKAAKELDVEGLRACLAAGADPNLTEVMEVGSTNQTALHHVLFKVKNHVFFKEREGPLEWDETMSVSLDITQLLLKAGANPNAKDDNGWTPLFRAPVYLMEELVNAGADVNALNNSQDTCLGLSTWFTEQKHVAELIRLGADVDVKACGHAPLHNAAERGHVEIIRMLLEAGAEVDIHEKLNSATPLHIATGERKISAMKELIKGGACVFVPNAGGYTALDYALSDGLRDPRLKDEELDRQAIELIRSAMEKQMERIQHGDIF